MCVCVCVCARARARVCESVKCHSFRITCDKSNGSPRERRTALYKSDHHHHHHHQMCVDTRTAFLHIGQTISRSEYVISTNTAHFSGKVQTALERP